MRKPVMSGLCVGLCCGWLLAGEEQGKSAATVNQPAPQFSGETYGGETMKLERFKGEEIVVLEWFNHECPVCRGHVDQKTIIKLVEDYPEVQFIGVDSTYKHRDQDEAVLEFIENKEINYPIIKDPEGTIGKMYGAKTTPHMFVIDQEGILRYSGAIDDRRSGDGETNYVSKALQQLQAGETVEISQSEPYGCSVKYKGMKGRKRGWGREGRRGKGGGKPE